MKVVDRLLEELAQMSPEMFIKRCPPEMLIDALAYVTGYDEGFLANVLQEMELEAMEAGEPVDISYFVGVTLERDW